METPQSTTNLRAVEYYIDTFMDDAPDCTRWHYSEAGWRENIVVGQMDIAVLTTEAEHKLSITRFLGYKASEACAVAYGVRDLEDVPMLSWVSGTPQAAQVQCRQPSDLAFITVPDVAERLASFAQLLPYGVPVADDILAAPLTGVDIHTRPTLTEKLLHAQSRIIAAAYLLD